MSARVSMVLLAFGLTLAGPVLASDVGYLYGRVETVDGGVYEGQLRWGTEESFWDDIFNANKLRNENIEYLDAKVLEQLRWRNHSSWDFFGDRDNSFSHLFAIRFGDLKRIDVRRGEDLVVEFRNGETLRLRGGSNDVGAEITVVEPKQGRHMLKWNRIRMVEFTDTPARLREKLGEPIYGEVKFRGHTFEGRIQWDNDECLTIDELDGETRDGKASVAFRDIASIRKERQGARVTLKSGAELYLTGSNDVNHENRGVIVVVPGLGTVKVGWRDFEEATFAPAPNSGDGYAEYAGGRSLSGEVMTRDGSLRGRIVFDLDESWDFEILHGRNGDTEFLIPFRDIVRITPRGLQRSDVEVSLGLTIELEESQDVSRKNDGLLVFTNGGKPRYVAWQEVTELRLAGAEPR